MADRTLRETLLAAIVLGPLAGGAAAGVIVVDQAGAGDFNELAAAVSDESIL